MKSDAQSRLSKSDFVFVFGFAIAYFAAAEIGHLLSFPNNFASFWPPSGIYVAALLVSPYRRWPYYCCAAIAGNAASDIFFHDKSLAVSLGFSFGNTLAAVIGAWLNKKFFGNEFRLNRLSEILAYCAISGLLAMTIGATVGAATVTLAFGGSYWSAWQTWWISGVLGVFVIGPLIIEAMAIKTLSIRSLASRRIIEFISMMVGLGISAEYVFGQQSYPLTWLILPCLLWAALRFERLGIHLAICFVAVISVIHTAKGEGPFGTISMPNRILIAQNFVSSLAVTFLVVAAVIKDRKRVNQALRVSESRYGDLFDNMKDMVAIVTPDGGINFANPAFHKVLGYTETELPSVSIFQICHPEEKQRCRQLLDRLIQGESLPGIEVRVLTKNGEQLILEGDNSPMTSEKGVIGVRTIYRDVTARKQTESKIKKLQEELHARVFDLEAALDSVRQLSGLLPICAWCKKIRDDRDYWHEVEAYIASHTDATFTHGMCPTCYAKAMKSV